MLNINWAVLVYLKHDTAIWDIIYFNNKIIYKFNINFNNTNACATWLCATSVLWDLNILIDAITWCDVMW